jgi:DNA-directed RNA polymerase subunit RPC12/RpoP
MTEKIYCALCGNPAPDGLRIHGEVVCSNCESRLLAIGPKDDDYEKCLAALRNLWSRWTTEPERK